MPTLEAFDAVRIHSMGYFNTNHDQSNSGTSPRSSDSICLARGRSPDDGEPLVPGIVQSTTFCRSGVGSDPTHQYSRVSNPSVATLEGLLGDLEDAPPGVCFGTGLAAEVALFLSLLKNGDHVICGRCVYGGTTRLLQQLLGDLGIETTFVDATDTDEIRSAVRSNTKLVFIETPANPTLGITDIRACSDIAKDAGALLAVDNTFLTGVLQRPLDHGADISVYSTTKFVDGHSVALGGALVSKNQEVLDRIRFIRKCTGAIQSPFNAWLTINGLKTLPLRIRAQSQSASKLARWLSEQPEIKAVFHPSLASGDDRVIADRQHIGEHGAVVSFEIVGGYDAGCCFVEQLNLCTLVEHVGSVETLITHPASMTHADVPTDQRRAVGISDGLLRLSVGLEGVDELIEDLGQALKIAASRCSEVLSA
tara:strand:- start:36997 stop:38265 length:1269 start_codon:yes stop_codon:yes gene_type:complete